MGIAVRDQLLAEGVLFSEGKMYFLNTELLSKCVGLTFEDVRNRRMTPKAAAFLKRVITEAN